VIVEVRGATLAFGAVPRAKGAADCSICDAVPDEPAHLAEVLGAIERTPDLGAVYVRATDPGAEDGGARLAEEFVREIKKRFDLWVALDAAAPQEPAWIDRTYAMGVDAVTYSLEPWDWALGEEILPALRHASTVFPAGAVTSHLVIGAQPDDALRAAIDAIADAGAVPVLAAAAGASCDPSPLYEHARAALRRTRLPTRWVRTLCASPSPLERALYGAEPARGALSRVAAVRWSDLRRLLRVRRVRDSLDSSGL
jgi:hypothetical protein